MLEPHTRQVMMLDWVSFDLSVLYIRDCLASVSDVTELPEALSHGDLGERRMAFVTAGMGLSLIPGDAQWRDAGRPWSKQG